MEKKPVTQKIMSSENIPSPTINAPPSRRVLLFALAPVVLLLLLTAAIRLTNEAATRREEDEQAQLRKQFAGASAGGKRPKVLRPVPPPARTADKTTQSDIEVAIRGQLTAITAGQFADALRYSAAEFRAGTTPERFQMMIARGYPAMTSLKAVTFSPAQIRAGGMGYPRQAMLDAQIETLSGDIVKYGYTLLGDQDGWRVQGVYMMSSRPDERAGLPAPPPRKSMLSMPPQDLHNI